MPGFGRNERGSNLLACTPPLGDANKKPPLTLLPLCVPQSICCWGFAVSRVHTPPEVQASGGYYLIKAQKP